MRRPSLTLRPVGTLGSAVPSTSRLFRSRRKHAYADARSQAHPDASPRELSPVSFGQEHRGGRMHNKSVETDAQRHCAASRAGEPTSRGAMPLRAAHLQRYTTAGDRCGHRKSGKASLVASPFGQVLRRVAVTAIGKVECGPSLGAVASAAGLRLPQAPREIEDRRIEGPRLAPPWNCVASSQTKALGLGAVGSRLPQVQCGLAGRRFRRRRLQLSGHTAARDGAQCGMHNKSFDADAQVLPCAARTRLPVAGQLQR